jgi:hypothetical protein
MSLFQQGLFVFIFHCFLDKEVQNALKKTRQRWSSATPTAKPKVENFSCRKGQESKWGDATTAAMLKSKSSDDAFDMKDMEPDSQTQQRKPVGCSSRKPDFKCTHSVLFPNRF